MGRIYQKRPGGPYYADFYERIGDGWKRRRRSTYTTDRSVAKERLRAYERGEAGASANKATGWTLKGAIDRLVASKRREGTKHCYTQRGGHLVRVIGELVDMGSIVEDDVTEYIDQRRGEGAKDHSIHKELVVLRGALRIAKIDPRGIVPPFSADYTPRTRYLTRDEFSKLMDACPTDGRRLWIVVSVFTSANLSECLALRWEDIDFTAGIVQLHGKKRKKRTRKVPLAAELRPWLDAYRQPTGPVLRYWSNVSRDLKRWCVKAQIPKVTHNDLRRTFGSWLKQEGVDSKTVADLMGHESTRMVDQVYGQLNAKAYRDAIDKLGGGDKGVTHEETLQALLALVAQSDDDALKQKALEILGGIEGSEVPRPGIEPGTRGFSVRPPSPPNQPDCTVIPLRAVQGGDK